MTSNITSYSTAFLGFIGGPEIIMILVLMFLLAVPVVVVLGIVLYSRSRRQTPPPIPNRDQTDERSSENLPTGK